MTLDALAFPVIDGHNDLPWERRESHGSGVEGIDTEQGTLHTDLPKLRAGGVVGQFWSVFVPSDDPDPVRTTLQQIDTAHRIIARYPDDLTFVRTAAELRATKDAGRIGSFLGAEGGHSIGDDLAVLRTFARLGVRYMTLTHNDDTTWADSATGARAHGGLTDRGREVVAEMERTGMLVDLSHVSPDTMRAALRVSTAPVIFSHSSARAVADHPRNVPDDVLRLTAANGGVVMINFFSGFVHPESARRRADMFEVSRRLRAEFPVEADYRAARRRWDADHPIDPGTVHDVVDHIDHVVRVAGVDHVGLGSDFDGVGTMPAQLHDVSTYPVITQELLTRGYAAAEIHKILSGNVLRVLRAAGRPPP